MEYYILYTMPFAHFPYIYYHAITYIVMQILMYTSMSYIVYLARQLTKSCVTDISEYFYAAAHYYAGLQLKG